MSDTETEEGTDTPAPDDEPSEPETHQLEGHVVIDVEGEG